MANFDKQDILRIKPSKGNEFIYRYYDEDGSYIGHTKRSIKDRAGKDGYNYLHSNGENKWKSALQEKGFAHFNVEILCECKKEEAADKEIKYIKAFDSYHFGYNSTPGGNIYYDGIGEIHISGIEYKWDFEGKELSAEAQKLNLFLCEQLNIENPTQFDRVIFEYTYYFFEEEYVNYLINLGLLIDNFNIYDNAAEILDKYSKYDGGGLFDYLVSDWCPSHECLGGDIITGGGLADSLQ